MKLVQPKFEILNMMDGEQALSLIERIGRVCYKSEDKIDDGYEECDLCKDTNFETLCPKCRGQGVVLVREPSSHRFVRSILKTNRREKLIEKGIALLDKQAYWTMDDPDNRAGVVQDIVDMVLREMRDDPSHESVIEHVSFTVLFTVDRGVSHELVRHRLAAFTQESTRYCCYSEDRFGNEIVVVQPMFWTDGDAASEFEAWCKAMLNSETQYMVLSGLGAKPQEARSVLPNSLKTEIVCTANLREWRHIFRLRTSPKAHPQMREVMEPLLAEARSRMPVVFDDLFS